MGAPDPPRLTHLRATWRAAMRGRRLPVAQDMLYQLLASVPSQAEEAIVIYPCEDGTFACRWIGMNAERAARTLYAMADGVVNEKIPIKKWTPPT